MDIQWWVQWRSVLQSLDGIVGDPGSRYLEWFLKEAWCHGCNEKWWSSDTCPFRHFIFFSIFQKLYFENNLQLRKRWSIVSLGFFLSIFWYVLDPQILRLMRTQDYWPRFWFRVCMVDRRPEQFRIKNECNDFLVSTLLFLHLTFFPLKSARRKHDKVCICSPSDYAHWYLGDDPLVTLSLHFPSKHSASHITCLDVTCLLLRINGVSEKLICLLGTLKI